MQTGIIYKERGMSCVNIMFESMGRKKIKANFATFSLILAELKNPQIEVVLELGEAVLFSSKGLSAVACFSAGCLQM
jgi:hypothetical protein